MKLNKPAMLAALSCLTFAGCAGAASLSQITPKSVDVEFTYPSNPLTLYMTALPDLRPGSIVGGGKWADLTLTSNIGEPARMGFRWAENYDGQAVAYRHTSAIVDGHFNPENKLNISFYVPDSDWVEINGESYYVLKEGKARPELTGSLGAPQNTITSVNADRYKLKLEAAVYRP